MSRALTLLLSVLLWTYATLAHAQDAATPSAETEQQARALFQSGLAHSAVERWAEAAIAFEASAQLIARPSTLQNLVAALKRSGQNEAAIRAIDRYLALATTDEHADTRHQLEETRVSLQRELAEQRPSQATKPEPTGGGITTSAAPTAVPKPKASTSLPPTSKGDAPPSTVRSRRALRWVSFGTSAALVTTASALLISSELDANRWRERCATQECPEGRLAAPQRSIDRRDRAGYALFGLAAASAALGATLLWLDLRAERQLKLGIAPTHATLRLRF